VTVVVVKKMFLKDRLERNMYMGVWSLDAKLRVKMMIDIVNSRYLEGTK
jgi:hypothetical protein